MPLIPCTAPVVTPVVAIIAVAMMGQFLVLRKISLKRYRLFVLVQVVLLAFTLGMGSYRASPLFSDTNILRGFNVTVRDRLDAKIKSGEIITIGKNSIAAIVPLTLSGDIVSCNWSSKNGGTLDDAASCELIYAPPSADYDILRLSIKSGCGLSDSVGQIKLSILP